MTHFFDVSARCCPTAQREGREAVPDDVDAPLLVCESAVEHLRPDLHNEVQRADIELALSVEPDLEITLLGWPNPWLVRAVDGLGDDVGQRLAETSKEHVIEGVVIDDVDERHGTESCAACSAGS